MSTWPVPSLLDPATQIFPTLTSSQINRLRSCGKVRKVEAGEILFEPGDTNIPFFVYCPAAWKFCRPMYRVRGPLSRIRRATLPARSA